jgi:micrococcal nuclease
MVSTALARQEPAEKARDCTKATAYPVVRVIDGDTIVVRIKGQDTRVPLIGVDTPETVHPSKQVEFYGKEAPRFTTNLLQGESVYLEYDWPKTDRYGRLLAYVYRASEGLFVNAEIIRQGYGHACTQYPFTYLEEFRAYERAARDARRGLWGEEPAAVGAEVRNANAVTVYATRTGKCYHREGCYHLSRSKIPISVEEARKRYRPCSACQPPIPK